MSRLDHVLAVGEMFSRLVLRTSMPKSRRRNLEDVLNKADEKTRLDEQEREFLEMLGGGTPPRASTEKDGEPLADPKLAHGLFTQNEVISEEVWRQHTEELKKKREEEEHRKKKEEEEHRKKKGRTDDDDDDDDEGDYKQPSASKKRDGKRPSKPATRFADDRALSDL